MARGQLTRGERLQIMLMPEELAALDDFRFNKRMPSRAAAVRELFRLALASAGVRMLRGTFEMKFAKRQILERAEFVAQVRELCKA